LCSLHLCGFSLNLFVLLFKTPQIFRRDLSLVVDNSEDIRVQGKVVTEKRNRWATNLILVFSLLAFVALPMIPLLNEIGVSIPWLGATPQESQVASSPSPTQSANPVSTKEQLQKQAEAYALVLQREPDNPTALRGLLEARLGLGDVKGAIAPLEKLSKLNPNQTDYAILLAQAKQQIQDYEGAAQVYRDVLQVKQGDLMALQGLANLLQQQKRPEAAIGLLQDTIKAAPQANQVQPGSIDVSSVQVMLGGVYASQKQYDAAIASFDEATKADPRNFRPFYGKAVVLKNQNKTEEAKALFAKAAEMAPAQFRDQINQEAKQLTAGSVPEANSTSSPAPVPSPSPAASPSPAPSP
jgi:Flp pilus assembly protein TadD